MHLLLLLLLVSAAWAQTSDERLEFNCFRMRDDPQKQLLAHAYGYTPDLMRMTLLLRFSSSFYPQQTGPHLPQHNALLLDAYNAQKYRHIMKTSDANDDRDDHLDFNNKITIVTRAVQKRLSYRLYDASMLPVDSNGDGVAGGDGDSNQTDMEIDLGEGGATGSENSASDAYLYDLIQSAQLVNLQSISVIHNAVLMLDAQSSLWQHYNRFTLTRNLLTLEYDTADTALAQQQQSIQRIATLSYNGVTQLSCDPTFNAQFCLVKTSSGTNGGVSQLEVSGVSTDLYRLIVDPDAYINFLPVDLYMRWLDEKVLQLRWLDLASQQQGLYLDRRFEFKLHDSDDIILGVDMLHLFPRISYSLADRRLTVWFYTAQQCEKEEAVQIVYIFISLLLIYCFFHWATSSNYYVLYYMVRFESLARRLHLFAYRQVTCELVVMSLSVLMWILALVISVRGTINPFFPTQLTHQEQRTVLAVLYSFYYFLLDLYILLMTPEVTAALTRYYWRATHKKKSSDTVTPVPVASLTSRASSLLLQTGSILMGVKKRVRKAEDYRLSQVATVGTTTATQQSLPPRPSDWDETDDETMVLLDEAKDPEERHALYVVFIEHYQTALIRGSTALTIARNIILSQLILWAMILITNSYTESNVILLLFTMALTLYALYYQIKFTVTGIIYLQIMYESGGGNSSDKREGRAFFTLFIAAQVAIIIVQMVLGFMTTFLPTLRAINSQYSDTVLNVYVALILVMLTLASVYMVSREQSLLIQEKLNEQRALRDEQRAAYYNAGNNSSV